MSSVSKCKLQSYIYFLHILILQLTLYQNLNPKKISIFEVQKINRTAASKSIKG